MLGPRAQDDRPARPDEPDAERRGGPARRRLRLAAGPDDDLQPALLRRRSSRAQGFRKAKDLLAYWFPLEEKPLERLSRVAERFRKREPDIVVRNVSQGGLAQDLPKIREVYNEAWEKNWGFVPMTPEEMDFMAERLKPLLVEELLWLAEAEEARRHARADRLHADAAGLQRRHRAHARAAPALRLAEVPARRRARSRRSAS